MIPVLVAVVGALGFAALLLWVGFRIDEAPLPPGHRTDGRPRR